jgi:hypothetical protein
MRLVLMTVVLLATAAAVHASHGRRSLIGEWGGEHVAVVVTAEGTSLEMDCAHGSLPVALRAGKHGAFRTMGHFAPERPGPTRKEPMGPFTVRRGRPAKLFKCR